MSWSNHHPDHSRHVAQDVRDYCWRRDNGECQLRYPGICVHDAQWLDHIVGIAEMGGRCDDPENLQWVCDPWHKCKTAQQRWPKFGRQPERHPGFKR